MQKRRPIITPRRMMSTHQRAMPVKEEPKVVAVEVTASDQSEGDESEELELSDASSVENEEEESEDEGRSGEQFTESSNESEEGEEGQEGEAGGGEKEGEEVDDEENEIADKEELATPASIKEVEITNTKPASPLSTASPQSTMWNNAIGTLGLFSIRKASVSVADNARAPDLLVVPHQGELTAPASNDISRSSSFVSAVDMA
ncbi:hypothetical protein BC830DRAFT_212004 [Chytriomyces sp. MP71]|nr:hypothetical protein BC830DRAFT_212004 [Chytriomyces sp. MP71]